MNSLLSPNLKRFRRLTRSRILLPTLAIFIACGRGASAQPATDTPGKAINPPNGGRVPKTPEEKAKADQQIQEIMRQTQEKVAAMMKLPPAEQRAALRQLQEQGLRLTLTRAGVADLKIQDRIVAFVVEQDEARQKVRMAAAKVYLALEPQGNPTDERGMSALLLGYLNAVEDAKQQSEAATKALDADIHFSDKPHLRAALTLYGIVGDAAWFTGSALPSGQVIGSLSEFVNPPADEK